MASLITYDQAKTQLRLGNESLEDILIKMDHATAIVLDYLTDYRLRVEPTWSVATDPEVDNDFALVQAAILDVLGNLIRFRGDDEKPPQGPMTPMAEQILRGLKDPVLG